MKQISGQIDLFDYLKELETVCSHSGHKCNKKELWKVAETLDEIMCPHVCCRSCATQMCGARCNGSEEPETISPAQEYFNETGKRTYWQDSQGKPHYWWRQETIHPVEIMGICDDAFCPVCGDGIDELKWMDCDRCPSCGARISWEPWHRMNDVDNQELFGEDWRDKFGKMTKEQGQKK